MTTPEAFDDRLFDQAYERLAAANRCDAPGGAEHERVFRRWVAAGRPKNNLDAFIVEHANWVPPSLPRQGIRGRELIAELETAAATLRRDGVADDRRELYEDAAAEVRRLLAVAEQAARWRAWKYPHAETWQANEVVIAEAGLVRAVDEMKVQGA